MKKTQRNISRKYNFLFKKRYYITFILLIGSFLYLNNCKVDKKEYPPIKGKIIVIGNEPFTKLAVINNKEKVFILKCDKKTERILLDNQGKMVKISYKKRETIGKDALLTVTNIKMIENKKDGEIYE